MLHWLDENWPVLLSSQGIVATVVAFIRGLYRRHCSKRMEEAHTIVVATSDIEVAMQTVGVLQRFRVGPQGASPFVVLYRKRWTCNALKKNCVDYLYRVEGYCSKTQEQWVIEIGDETFKQLVEKHKG